jgi:uncharacterized membrane protein
MGAVEDFVFKYFINPVYTGEGYNIYNTAVFAVLLIASLYGIHWMLRKIKVKFDAELFRALLPYALLGGLLRASADFLWTLGVPKHWLLITPGIYIVMFILTVATLAACLTTKHPKKNLQLAGFAYLALVGVFVLWGATTKAANWTFFLATLALAAGLSLVAAFAMKKLKVFSRENAAVGFAQSLDASATAVALAFLGYGEQHVVSGLITDVSPWLFIPVKLAVAIGAVYVIDRHSDDEDWKWLLKFVVLVLGLGPGTRDATRALLGV